MPPEGYKRFTATGCAPSKHFFELLMRGLAHFGRETVVWAVVGREAGDVYNPMHLRTSNAKSECVLGLAQGGVELVGRFHEACDIIAA